jgi:Ca2+/H+ antiporter
MKQQIFLRTTILGGVITGLAWFLGSLSLYHIGLKPLGKQAFLFLPVYAACMMLILTWYRNYRNGGILQGSQAIVMGLLINLIASLVYASSLYLFMRFVNDNILQEHHADLLKFLDDNKENFIKDSGKETYQRNYDSIKEITPANIALDTILKTSFGGFFVAVIIALGLRKSA